MWYRFEEGNPVGILDVKYYQVAWYDMENDGACFDEEFVSPDAIGDIIAYVETEGDKNKATRSKVFVHFGNGDSYELKLEKINEV